MKALFVVMWSITSKYRVSRGMHVHVGGKQKARGWPGEL